MSNEWWQKIKPWILQGTLLLVLGLLGWFGISLLQGLIHTEMDEIQKLDVLREHKAHQLQQLPELEKQNALIEDRGGILDIVLTKDELVDFIRTLEQLAADTGVKIEIASKDNTLLESKITLQPQTKNQKTPSSNSPAQEDAPAPQPKRAAKQSAGLLDEISLKHYIRLTLTVTAPYKAMTAYLHKLETLPYATDIIGLTVKQAKDEKGEVIVPPSPVPEGAEPVSLPRGPLLLDAEFDMLVYTKE